MKVLAVHSEARQQMIDITAQVQRLVAEQGTRDGVVWLHCPHTTAALTVQENTDPALRADYLEHLAKLVPQPGFRHDEGNADAHIKSSLIGTTQPVLIEQGRLVLGQWQAIYFVELDGPRRRQVMARVSAS
jgi:secondary thiamine-phosphate synthase enzyme